MNRHSASVLFFAAIAASNVYCATGNLVIYDDTEKNGFDHPSAICSSNSIYGETAVVHNGTAAIAISRLQTSNGAGWSAPAIYSTSSDYDGVTFWVNAGSDQSGVTSLTIFDVDSNSHFLHLEDVYGAPLPANTWIQFQIPFSSPYFEVASSSAPATLQTICLINRSLGSNYLYLDDVALTGADIFKNGFDN